MKIFSSLIKIATIALILLIPINIVLTYIFALTLPYWIITLIISVILSIFIVGNHSLIKLNEYAKRVIGIPLKPRDKKNAHEKLMLSIRITAQCRFNAANTMRINNLVAFLTTTIVSLGLILIPLIQSSGIQTSFLPNVLNSTQIFFAVVILVYSVIINQAKYNVRAELFNDCGNKLKELSRKVDIAIESQKENRTSTTDEQFLSASTDKLQKYYKQYDEIVTSCEHHTNNNYLKAMLRMTNDFDIHGLKYIYYCLKWFLVENVYIIVPMLIVGSELFFILDMFGATNVFPNILKQISPLLPSP